MLFHNFKTKTILYLRCFRITANSFFIYGKDMVEKLQQNEEVSFTVTINLITGTNSFPELPEKLYQEKP